MLPIALVLHQGLVGCLFVQFRGTRQPDDGTQTQAGGWRAPTCSSQAGRHRRAGGDLAHCGAGQTPNTAQRCTTTPRQARPDTTDVTWTHGTTAELGQSGGSAGGAGQKKSLFLTYPTTKFLTAPVNMALGGIGISFTSTAHHSIVQKSQFSALGIPPTEGISPHQTLLTL